MAKSVMVPAGPKVAEPMFFGPEARLFGFYHAPAGTARSAAVVLVNPFGYEALCAHRAYRRLAERLAAGGFGTLRFDLDGTGDSAGNDTDPRRVAAWVASIGAAIDELQARTEQRKVVLVGVRLGALLALAAAAERGDLGAVVLIAPCVSGKAYVRELRAFRRMAQKDAGAPATPRGRGERDEEAAGFLLTEATLAELGKLDGLALDPGDARVLIVTRDDVPSGEERLVERLVARGADAESREAAGYGAMMQDAHKSEVPGPAFDAAFDWLKGAFPRVRVRATRMSAAPAAGTRASRASAPAPAPAPAQVEAPTRATRAPGPMDVTIRGSRAPGPLDAVLRGTRAPGPMDLMIRGTRAPGPMDLDLTKRGSRAPAAMDPALQALQGSMSLSMDNDPALRALRASSALGSALRAPRAPAFGTQRPPALTPTSFSMQMPPVPELPLGSLSWHLLHVPAELTGGSRNSRAPGPRNSRAPGARNSRAPAAPEPIGRKSRAPGARNSRAPAAEPEPTVRKSRAPGARNSRAPAELEPTARKSRAPGARNSRAPAELPAGVRKSRAPGARNSRAPAPEEYVAPPILVEVREDAAHFGDGDRLFGILTAPPGGPPATRPAIILLNAGAIHRVGPNRMYVALARKLAAAGFASLRFDVGGLGDSRPAPGTEENRVYARDLVADVSAAMTFVAERTGAARFIVVGLCSGAYLGFHTALDDVRVGGAVMINPQTLTWKKGDSLEIGQSKNFSDVQHYRNAAFRSENWMKVLRGEVDIGRAARTLGRRAAILAEAPLRRLGATREVIPENDVRGAFAEIARRRIITLMVMSAGDPGLDYLATQLGDAAARPTDTYRLEVVPGADHTFTPLWSQAELLARVLTFVRALPKSR